MVYSYFFLAILNYFLNFVLIIMYVTVWFTGVLPDALKTDCSKCTDVQKDRSEKVIKFLIKNRSTDFDRSILDFDKL